MNISINAHSIELTPALKEYVEKRFSGLAKFTGSEPSIVIDLDKTTEHHHKGDIFETKAHVTTPLGKQYHAASQKADMYEAIDDVRTEIVRLLTSSKDKKTTLFRRGAHKIKNILKGFRS
jgi:putative sigma-54 modulation protein